LLTTFKLLATRQAGNEIGDAHRETATPEIDRGDRVRAATNGPPGAT
jgi:hypothetical protein